MKIWMSKQMEKMTHRKARTLAQLALDMELSPRQKSELSEHIANCKSCREYASRLAKLERGLERVFHTQWDHYQPSLNLGAIVSSSSTQFFLNTPFRLQPTFKSVMLLTTCIMGFILSISFIMSRAQVHKPPIQPSLAIIHQTVTANTATPTPSIPLTMTSLSVQNCQTILYTTQPGDTLESIARQFDIPLTLIKAYNSFENQRISPGTHLLIPLCGSPPVPFTITPNRTLTITPLTRTLLSTQAE